MNNTKMNLKSVGVFSVLAVTMLASGCNQAISRRDSISPNFGNAMAANTALQTIDPWPRNVENTHIHTDGTKATNAIERYQAPADTESSEGPPNLIQAAPIAPKT